MQNVFPGEIFVAEKFFELHGFRGSDAERFGLGRDFAALPVKHAVGERMFFPGLNQFFDEAKKRGQIRDRASRDEIEMPADFLGAGDARLDVFQREPFRDVGDDADFLRDGIRQREMRLREQHGEQQPREAAARADVDHARAAHELEKRSRGETRRVVMPLEVVDVLAGNEVDFRVPLAVERRHRLDFFPRLGGNARQNAAELLKRLVVHRLISGRRACSCDRNRRASGCADSPRARDRRGFFPAPACGSDFRGK